VAISNEHAAFIIIDMQNGFIQTESSLCIAGAEATLPQCKKALVRARELAIPIFYIRREYAEDGSNIEAVRYETWLKGGKPLSTVSGNIDSLDFPEMIQPEENDCVITKPRFSAFFNTDLDRELRERSINTVILTGTTTPNCIRATCYDALSRSYNVVIIDDCTSSRSPDVQAANIADMAHIGAQIIDTATFCEIGLETTRDIESEHLESLHKESSNT